jgi:hypothetical protein
MTQAHPRPWRRDSTFGAGPRRPLDREQKARVKFLLHAHRRARRLTPHAELVGNALVRRLGVDGQLDPAHETIAQDVGCGTRTVRRALAALKALGLVMWQCRIVRDGWRCAQTSNSYVLVPGAGTLAAPACGGQSGRETKTLMNQGLTYLPPMSDRDREFANAALARRRAVGEAKAARKGLAAIAAVRMQVLGMG